VDYSRYEYLNVTHDAGVTTVVMNRPEILNAVNSGMYEELTAIWGDLNRDPETQAIVFTGAGRAFCSGGDLRSAKDRDFDPFKREMFRSGRRLVLSMLDVEAPIIAAVNGDAVGLGATLALLSDVVFAASSARIGETHVRMGAVSGDGGVLIWPLLVGPARAKQYLMTGDLIPAPEAERIGLINAVVEDEHVYEQAVGYARRLTELPPLGVRWTKHTINNLVRAQAQQVLDSAMALKALTLMTDDHHEAVTAYVEKRKTQDFQGR
jgi:enoyl-CoA hydratase